VRKRRREKRAEQGEENEHEF
jgi:hypothetical protein